MLQIIVITLFCSMCLKMVNQCSLWPRRQYENIEIPNLVDPFSYRHKIFSGKFIILISNLSVMWPLTSEIKFDLRGLNVNWRFEFPITRKKLTQIIQEHSLFFHKFPMEVKLHLRVLDENLKFLYFLWHPKLTWLQNQNSPERNCPSYQMGWVDVYIFS